MTKETKTEKTEKTEAKPEVKPEPPKDITELLGCIQRKLKAPKSQYNSFGKYHYRNCEDIQEAIKPLLPVGAYLKISDKIVMVGDRFYVEATASLHYKDKVETNTAYAREPADKKGMDASQITGATSSYARKYALNGLLLIDDNKDADSDNKDKKDEKDNFTMGYDDEQNKSAHDYALKYIEGSDTAEKIDSFLEKNKNKLKNLPKEMYDDVLAKAAEVKTDLNHAKSNGHGAI